MAGFDLAVGDGCLPPVTDICDFACQPEGAGLVGLAKAGRAVDGVSQTDLVTRDVYCQARGDMAAASAQHDDDWLPRVTSRRVTTDTGAGPSHAVRRGQSDVTCQVDSEPAVMVHVHSQCDLMAGVRRGAGETMSDRRPPRPAPHPASRRRSSASQCSLMTSSHAQCQTTPTRATSAHAHSQTPAEESEAGRGGVSVWAGTDTPSQTGEGRCHVTSQTGGGRHDVTSQSCDVIGQLTE